MGTNTKDDNNKDNVTEDVFTTNYYGILAKHLVLGLILFCFLRWVVGMLPLAWLM